MSQRLTLPGLRDAALTSTCSLFWVGVAVPDMILSLD